MKKPWVLHLVWIGLCVALVWLGVTHRPPKEYRFEIVGGKVVYASWYSGGK